MAYSEETLAHLAEKYRELSQSHNNLLLDLQVVESTEPKAEPDVGWDQAGIEGVRLSRTQPNPKGGMNRGLT